MNRNIAVIIPTLNEEKTIAAVIGGFKKNGFNNIYVIDGHSIDKTVYLAKKAGAKVIIQTGRGKGNAIRQILEQIKYDIYILIDGDGTYPPSEAKKLLGPVLEGKADMVVGVRNKTAIPSFNRLGNYIFNIFLSLSYGVKLKDILSGYRVFTRELAENINILSDYFEVETELTINTLEKKFKIIEIPIGYKPRVGKTKLNPIKDGAKIGLTLIRMVRDYKPLVVFMGVSLISFIVGISIGLYVLNIFLQTGTFHHIGLGLLSILLVSLSIQFFSIGILADMISRRFKRIEEELRKGKK